MASSPGAIHFFLSYFEISFIKRLLLSKPGVSLLHHCTKSFNSFPSSFSSSLLPHFRPKGQASVPWEALKLAECWGEDSSNSSNRFRHHIICVQWIWQNPFLAHLLAEINLYRVFVRDVWTRHAQEGPNEIRIYLKFREVSSHFFNGCFRTLALLIFLVFNLKFKTFNSQLKIITSFHSAFQLCSQKRLMPQQRKPQNSFKVSAYVGWETEAQREDHTDMMWQGQK